MNCVHRCLWSVVVLLCTCAAAPFILAQEAESVDFNSINNPETRTHYSLYAEHWKNKNWQDALSDLLWILDKAPAFPPTRNNDANFRRAVDIYEGLALESEDPEKKRVWLDSALVIFDRAPIVLQAAGAEVDPFEWKRNKGRFIQTHIAHLGDRTRDLIEAYRGAYELDKMRIDPYYLDVIINDLYQRDDIGGALDFLREIKEVRGEEAEVDNLIRKYFVVIPPDEQIAFLEEQYAAEPDNAEVITQLFDLYQQEAYRDKMLELAPKILAMEPSASTLRMLTRMYVEDGDNEQAFELFEQMKALPDIELRAEDYYNIGLAHQDMENYRQARDHYRQALEVDPEFDRAKVAIPNLYATAVSACGVADREQSAVFWLIADAYARIGDSDGVRRMATAFPTAEDVFYVARWTNGEPTQVSYTCRGLTISGTTTVRQR